jgi:pyrimidine-specific ribonucleoside hydrolase
MRRAASRLGWLIIIVTVAGCSGVSGTTTPGPSTGEPSSSPPTSPDASPSEPAARTILVDTDVAGDDLVALAFLVSAPHVNIAAIAVSGTGEAHCEGGVDVVLRLLEALDAPDIPVACGRETPLAGTHAFPDAWREGADHGSGLDLPQTDRQGSSSTAIELIEDLSTQHRQLLVLTLGPLTNLADALTSDADLAKRLGPVFVMGGALHVPGNLLGPGAPEGNSVAEWNVYVDPHAAQVVVDAGLEPSFVSLDGTSQVPVTRDFARRAMKSGETAAARVLAELFAANPFMTDGSYFLWDALAAELAAGYPVGSFSAAGVVVEEAEGPESGFTRPSSPTTNIKYLSEADSAAATDTLLRVLNGD